MDPGQEVNISSPKDIDVEQIVLSKSSIQNPLEIQIFFHLAVHYTETITYDIIIEFPERIIIIFTSWSGVKWYPS